jgi:hypothetical protein
MSQRMGMADGRCITEFASNRIMTDALMAEKKIEVYDNYTFRQVAQEKGPEGFVLPLRNAACRTGQVQVLVENE